MAYTPITENEIESLNIISQSLLNKVKDNFTTIKTTTEEQALEIQNIKTQEVWKNITYQNGWSSYDSYWAPLSYYKDKTGRVHLRGMAKGPIQVALGNLPVGYRPSGTELFVANSSHQLGRIDIDSIGNITAIVGPTTQWISFSGISFRAV